MAGMPLMFAGRDENSFGISISSLKKLAGSAIE